MPTAITERIPHTVTKDDERMSYHISKSATLMNNVYNIHMDSERYTQGFSCMPEPSAADTYVRDGLEAVIMRKLEGTKALLEESSGQ